jgi:hypothetical protein
MTREQYARVLVGLTLAVAFIGCKSPGPAASAGVKVTDIEVGRSVAPDKTIADETDSFRPNDTIYLSVKTDGSGPSATLTARWTYEDGQLVDESRQDVVASGASAVTEFHLSKPDGWPAGEYMVEVLLNGTPAGSKDFKVS